MKKTLWSAAFLTALVGATFWTSTSRAANVSPLVPTKLRCEYLTNPTGLDAEKPRFGWILETKDADLIGLAQTAYRLKVDAAEADAKAGAGKVWDSGWVESDRSTPIDFNGAALKSDSTYYWTVQVKDQDGVMSEPSAVATWTTGLFDASEWSAKWIGAGEIPADKKGVLETTTLDPKTGTRNDPWLRKTFELDSVPERAVMFVASVGYHEVYVNGEQVDKESVLAPNVSNHKYRARYLAYDLKPLLRKGKNVVALWLGNSWSVYSEYATPDKPKTPIVIAQADLRFGDGTSIRIATDKTWKWAKSPNSLIGEWNFHRFGGERYDANLENADWNKADFDDSAWKNATEFAPKLELSAQATERNILGAEIKPVKIEAKGDNVWRVDMGVNFAGWTEFKVKGKPGTEIAFEYSERNQDARTFGLNSVYVIGPSGEGVFKNRFNYSSGRWITVRGLTEAPKLEDVRGWHVRTGYADAADFETSNDLQNWIYNVGTWTFENLSVGGYVVDCPQRERMGYGGDAHATSESGMYNYALEAFYYKWLKDWRDCQKDYADGCLPCTAPTYWGGGGPSWGGIVITLPWTFYLQYGDTRILEENFETIEKWLAFLDLHVENDLLKRYGDEWRFLGDWLWPGAPDGPNSHTPQALCLNNIYRVFNLKTAAQIARVIGKEERAVEWEAKAEAARKAINAKYFKPEEGSYFDDAQAILGLALLTEIAPTDADAERVVKRLEKAIYVDSKGHIGAGITGGGLLYRYLRYNNRDDLIYSTLKQTEYPSWGFMRKHDATTYWEAWELDRPGHSLLHSSYLYPVAWYVSNVLGIQRDAEVVAFKKFTVRPPKAGATDLTFAKGAYRSIVGEIKSSWEKKPTGFELSVVVPPNTSATVYVPKTLKNGKIEAPRGAKFVGDVDGFGVFEVPSGSFFFKESK